MPVPALLATYAPFPFTLERGLGDRVWGEDGREWIDFYGGHCVCVTGHCHPRVVEAIRRQAGELVFYSTAGRLTIREQAAEALVEFAGGPMASVFFCNSGAEANENALKIAAKLTGRHTILAFEGGWHGRSMLCLSATDDPPLQRGYEPWLAPVRRATWGESLEAVDPNGVAAVILEPIQSMAGCRTAPAEWFREVRAWCDRHGAMLILDEIQTGFGRLGAPFAFLRYGVAPDLVTCAKGIASGVPMGAVLMTEAVAEGLGPGDLGTTFGGGPIACAAMLATLGVVLEEGLAEAALAREAELRAGLAEIEFTGEGLLLGLRFGERAKAMRAHLLEQGILVGGSHDPGVVRLLPPLVLRPESVDRLVSAVRAG